MERFQKVDGTKIPDLGEYVVNYLGATNHDIKVFIGCDSMQAGDKTSYVLAICLYETGKGAHVIIRRDIIPRIKDLFIRLWQEIEYSKDVADYLTEYLLLHFDRPVELCIHVDTNPKKSAGSNKVYEAAKGYLKGIGYDAEFKPLSPAASFAADKFL
jgi:predicted RNase H-related nuclease YkuK (DUF458 family)